MAKKKKRTQGHYCKICGEYKANEKFSGKGHATHICKMCLCLSAEEKAEAMTMNRLMELPFRHLSASDKKWLENRIHDKRPEVAEAAREVYRECFPYAYDGELIDRAEELYYRLTEYFEPEIDGYSLH